MGRLFITGTGTDVGKTVATAGLAALAADAGIRVAVVKPVQTGIAEYPSDISVIRGLAPGVIDIPEADAIGRVFPLPASPHLAAAEAGESVSLRELIEFVERIERRFTPELLLIEGAGGVMVPLNEKEMFVDLMKALDAPTLVVALAGLGTINHTLLTVEHLKRNELEVAGLIVNRFPRSPSVVERDNADVVERFSGTKVVAAIRELSVVAPSGLLEEFKRHPALLDLFY